MRKLSTGCRVLSCCAFLCTLALFSISTLASTATAGQLIISEFRLLGPNGTEDEFVEIYNNTDTPHTVATSDGSAGYALAASDGVIRFTIPNGTVIPARGHFLGVNSDGYSLSSYATGDATYTTDIPNNTGIALFNTANTANFTLTNRLDAVGSTSETNTLYKEGTGYPALTPFLIDYSFFRMMCVTATTSCPVTGIPNDTNDNSVDFLFADTDATNAGAGQRLGAPGPENLTSPVNHSTAIAVPLLDATVAANSSPNRVRDTTSNPSNNSTLGTLAIRRRIVNNTGASVTRLRFRVIGITTFPSPSSGIADLRVITSATVSVSGVNDPTTCFASNGVSTTPCTVSVKGTTLEQPPSQPNGGGYNSTLAVGTVTTSTPLAPGASVNVQLMLGVEANGSFSFFIIAEALP